MGKRWKCEDFLKSPTELPPLFALFFCYVSVIPFILDPGD